MHCLSRYAVVNCENAGTYVAQSNPPFMSGVPELLVLQVLAAEEMYGYELIKRIRLVTDEAVALGEGVVYPALHALERSGSLRSRRKLVNGRPRVYYRITAKGRKRLDQLTGEWRRVNGGISVALAALGHA